jgi:hypothetical protein
MKVAGTTGWSRSTDANLYAGILICYIAFACLVFFAPKSAPNGFWALQCFDSHSPIIRFALLALPFAIAVKPVQRITLKAFTLDPTKREKRFLRTLFIFAISFLVFWLFRENRHWGDAATTVKILEGTIRIKVLGQYFWKEPLDRLMAIGFYAIGKAIFGWGAEKSIALMNALFGGAYVAVLYLFATRIARSIFGAAFFFTLNLAMGTSQLFFGHVENYTIVSLGILLCLYLGHGYAHGRVPLYTIWLCAAVTVSVHGLAAFLLPALVILSLPGWTSDSWGKHAVRVFRAVLPGCAYLAVFYGFCRWLGAGPLPIGVNRFADNMQVLLSVPQAFQGSHLWAVFQCCLLIYPLGLVLGSPWMLADFRECLRYEKQSVLFFLTAAVSFFVFMLFFNGTLPRWNDWDLFAPAAIPTTVLGAYLFVLPRACRTTIKRTAGIFILAASLAFAGAWISSNYKKRATQHSSPLGIAHIARLCTFQTLSIPLTDRASTASVSQRLFA